MLRMHSWNKTRKLSHLSDIAYSLNWVTCNRPRCSNGEDRTKGQKLIAFQDTATLALAFQLPVASCWSSHRFISPTLEACWLRTCPLRCTPTVNSIMGPWYRVELPAATLDYILTTIIRTNKKSYNEVSGGGKAFLVPCSSVAAKQPAVFRGTEGTHSLSRSHLMQLLFLL